MHFYPLSKRKLATYYAIRHDSTQLAGRIVDVTLTCNRGVIDTQRIACTAFEDIISIGLGARAVALDQDVAAIIVGTQPDDYFSSGWFLQSDNSTFTYLGAFIIWETISLTPFHCINIYILVF